MMKNLSNFIEQQKIFNLIFNIFIIFILDQKHSIKYYIELVYNLNKNK